MKKEIVKLPVYLGLLFALGGLPFGFAVTDFPPGILVSGLFVYDPVPLRSVELPFGGG